MLSGRWPIRSLLVHPREHKEKAEQSAGDEQKQKQECGGADRSIAVACLFPHRAFLDQFQLELAR